MKREDVSFKSGGLNCWAWLYTPQSSQKAPIIVMGHGLGAVKEMQLDVIAELFTAAGYACLVFDYRHFGESEGEPRQLLKISSQLEDWRAAIKYSRNCDRIDHDKIILWGSSFGGGHALSTAAKDHNIAAVIAQCPFTNGLASSLTMPISNSVKLFFAGIKDVIGNVTHQKPTMVPLFEAPGKTALMTAPDVANGYKALIPENSSFKNEIAARFVFDIIRYYPGRSISKITCPTLLCVCEKDTVAPAKATIRHAQNAKNVVLKIYNKGHFDIYTGENLKLIIQDQILFLNDHVL